ncbi:MAG TPA: hypothetical protein PLS90_01070 [Candidatus Sumerlaeota bacterium]|nr:hypothetical protein [Candidatus Sumerlaeota bacterium]HOR27725.1 hypothetical protein [Candidatus Sumerlaeota bacterium]HPK01022.1 hypothetical protein [Candidatus Sumerlaeota bacterium]
MLRWLFFWFRPARLLWPVACLALTAAAWLFVNYDTLQRYLSERERLEHYRSLVAEEERLRDEMIGERAALQAGGFPAEKAIRERFIMVKPGEQILFIEPPAGKDEADAAGGDSKPSAPGKERVDPAEPVLPETD